LRVLLYSDADVIAGTEQHMLTLASGLVRAGVEVILAAPRHTPLEQRCADRGIPFQAIEKGRAIDGQAIATLVRMLQAGAVNVVHAHNGRSVLQAALAKRRARRGKVVFTQHFLHPASATRRGIAGVVSRRLNRWVYRQVDRIIAPSDAIRDAAIERGDTSPERIVRVHHGIERPEDNHSSGVAGKLLCAARLQAEKRIDVLIDAAARITVPFSLDIVGGGDLQPALQARIDALGIGDRVKLLGFCSDVQQRMREARVVILPSSSEPFGLVLLEAMSLGRAVIASRSGGPKEIVIDGQTGLLFEPDDPVSLAATMQRLLVEPTLAIKMGMAGCGLYQARFQAKDMVHNTLAVYRQVMGHA
jgi:glycosyltransferase involved in cell wall biosynthesis